MEKRRKEKRRKRRMKKVIWYAGYEYKHPRKTKNPRRIWKPIIVYVKEKKKDG